jgi:hypothetical protein
MVGATVLFCTIAALLSQVSQAWATFFSNWVIPVIWQFGIAISLFTVLYIVLKIFFSYQFDDHKRTIIALAIVAAFIISLPILALIFERSLDVFDIIFGLIINILGGMLVYLIDERIG